MAPHPTMTKESRSQYRPRTGAAKAAGAARAVLCLLMVFFVGAQPAAIGSTAAPVAPVEEGCRRCDHQGVVVCPKHSEELLEAEARVHFCSLAAACEDCGGTLKIDCKHCDGGPGEAAVEARRAEIQAWLAENEVEAHFGRPVPRCETEHLQLTFEPGAKIKAGRKVVDPHLLMHQVADDCEFVATKVKEHFNVQPEDKLAKMRMWFWSSGKDHLSAVQAFMQIAATGDFKMLGKDPVFSVWQEPGLFSTAPAIRSLFAHNIAHMIVSNLVAERDISIIGGGWFDAGVGHWYEYERFERSTNYCTEEASAVGQFSGGIWKASIRKLVEKASDNVFVPLMDKPTTTMTSEEQAICWSFYDWLVAEHQEALMPLLRGLKIKTSSRDLFQEHLGMNVLKAEETWRAWVSATYPKKEKIPRRR